MRFDTFKEAYRFGASRFAAVTVVVLFCAIPPALYADSQQTVGNSPTAYTSPNGAQKELKQLLQLFKKGRISQAEYQKQLLLISATNKQGLKFNDPAPANDIDPLNTPPPFQPIQFSASKAITSMIVSPPGEKLNHPLRKKHTIVESIQRPGPIRGGVVAIIDDPAP